jgi:membrane protein DedA with SNARE-associated domain
MKFSHFLIVAGFTLWIAETAYFGFNLYAVSNAEKFLDNISFALIVVGIIVNAIRININININKNGE